MNEYWKERIQFMRDLDYLTSVFESYSGYDEDISNIYKVQTIVEDQLINFLQQNIAAHEKMIKEKQ